MLVWSVQKLPTRHTLDAMHCEKRFVKIYCGRCLARQMMRNRGRTCVRGTCIPLGAISYLNSFTTFEREGGCRESQGIQNIKENH